MSPPTPTTTPQELRQNILKYAFNDAGDRDLYFNETLRTTLMECHELQEANFGQSSFFLATLRYPARLTKGTYLVHSYFPNIYIMALALKLAIPELQDDVMFVLGNALSYSEKESEAVIEESLDRIWRAVWRFPLARKIKPSK